MITFLLDDDFHLGRKFQKSRQLNLIKGSDLATDFHKIFAKKSLWLTKVSSFNSLMSRTFLEQEIYPEQMNLKRNSTLILFGGIDESLRSNLSLLFRNLIIVPDLSSLPVESVIEVLSAKEPEKYIICVESDIENETLLLVRGNLDKLIVPFSLFKESGDGVIPDFSKPGVADHGQTLMLGEYEASVDSIFYEFDSEYRKKLKKDRSKKEKTLGACLRRVRLQKGLNQSDFPGIDEKEIGRIERGEVMRPHQGTLEKIAERLGIKRDEILSY